MTIYSLLKKVHANGIKLWQEKGQLKIKAPKGALTKEIREQIISHKAEILAFLNEVSKNKNIPKILPSKREDIKRNPLSFEQERLWIINQLNTEGFAYSVPITFILKGTLDISIANKAFNTLIVRHESLRTIFPSKDGKAEQLILDTINFTFETIDLSSFKAKKERYRKAREICEKESSLPFNLEKGPLVRGKIIKISAQEHIIMINCHHIISDDWSVNVLLEEFFKIFDALNMGKEAKLPKLPIQYLDYCIWQREKLDKGEEIDRQLVYWEQKLAGTPESIDLRTDYPRPNIQSFKGASKEFSLETKLTKQLKKIAEQQGATLYMMLLAIFKTLLYRYTGQEDICIGSVIANRQHEETHGLIGMFVNTLALRTSLNSKDTFIDTLNKVKTTCGEAYQHQNTPFDKVVDKVKVQRNLALNPLFQIMVSQNIPIKLEKENIEPFYLDRYTSKFDMSIEFTENNNQLTGVIEYCTDLFKQDTIKRIINNYTVLCKAVAVNPTANITDLEILTTTEKQQLLIDFNNTQVAYDSSKCIHQFFAEQVKQNPKRIAVVYNNKQLTYQQLSDKCNMLALYLQSKGIKPDTLVGICMDRSVDMIVALLATLQAGGAYVPLDANYPDDRIAYMLEDSRASIVLTQENQKERLRNLTKHKAELIALDKQWDDIKKYVLKQKSQNVKLIQNVAENNLAYVIYTSGSTGKPKGVAIEHHSTVALINWASDVYSNNELAGVLASTSICFDLSIYEIFLPLSVGGKVILVPNALVLPDFAHRESITLINTVPSVMEELVRIEGAIPNSVLTINLAGEPLSPTLVNKIYKGSKVKKVYDLYGPSEDTTYSTFTLRVPNGQQTIGHPISNTQAYILDKFNNPLPIGVQGELHLAGEGLARCYLHQPKLTKEKFVPNPFKPNTRMYKTGDLVRWMDNGTIEYLGRIDRQVKVRGFRIEIGEIEFYLNKHPQIKESVVVAQGQGVHKKLVAFYVATATKQNDIVGISNDELNKHLRQFLSEFMIPSTYSSLETIPLTQNGKIDRHILERMEIDSDLSHNYLAPSDDIEDKLVNIWAQILNLKPEEIGVNDKFFDVGGNSINAVSLAANIEKNTRCKFLPVDLFKYSTIRNIGQYIHKNITNTQKQPVIKKESIRLSQPKKQAKEILKKSKNPAYYKDSLAIVGISCDFPEADDHWQFWENLVKGRESIHLLSKEEIKKHNIPSKYLDDPNYIPLKPWMEGKEFFDPEFFQISSGNAALMDPQFRQLLLHSWKAVEDAGYRSDEVEKTSVFMSASNNFYQSLEAKISSEGHVMENSEEFVSWILSQGGTIPTMISYQLGLKGPSTFVHSNCSSSLTALYYAYQSLQSKDVDYALIGAATLSASLSLGYLQMPGMNFSSDGHCKTFDKHADGMVDGEGVGVFLVKRAVDAIKDNDHIYCLLRGVSINNDGSDKVGFYAPSVNGQASVIQNTLEKTGINPETISYVEAHGTGTALGDPIEVKAISEAFEKYTDKKQFCAIGSVKPNIGHLDTAAGLAGCIKLAMSLYHKKLPPLINFKSPNPQIDFKNSPFYVLDKELTWTKEQYPKRVAISSFGIGGTNAHVILEEYNQANVAVDKTIESDAFMVPLSAKKEEVLLEYAQNLLIFLERKTQHEIKISDLAYTLQIGRKEMNFRVLFVVKSIDDLLKELGKFIENKSSDGYFKGKESFNKKTSESLENDEDYLEFIKHWFLKKKLKKLAKLWVNGTTLNWKLLYNGQYPKRISLPSYPFAKVRCWIDQSLTNKLVSIDKTVTSAVLHPLLHSNISDFSRQSYTSLFTGKEFFLADHQIDGQKVFPAVAYLEMVRAAVMQATSEQFSPTMLELSNLVWVAPIIANTEETQTIVNLSVDDNGQIAYEVVSSDKGMFTLHCEGNAEFKDEPLAEKLNIEQLSNKMENGNLDSNDIYTMFEEIGTQYGFAYQSVTKVKKGNEQLLAELKLPKAVESTFDNFLLHPSILDGALQASNVLFNDLKQHTTQDVLPFALKSLRIISTCSKDALVWARFAAGSKPEDRISKLDIDISDAEGNICIQLRGFSFRKVASYQTDINSQEAQLSHPVWLPSEVDVLNTPTHTNTERTDITESYIILNESQELNSKKIETLLPKSKCIQIKGHHNNIEEQFNKVALTCFKKIQSIFNAKPKGKVSFQFVINNKPVQSIFTSLSGLFKTAHLENPNFFGQIIQVEEQTTTENLIEILQENRDRLEDVSIKYIQGKRNILQWQPIELSKKISTVPFKDHGVYLITGGLGGLGILFTKEIIKQVANAHIILTGRTELVETKKESLAILNSLGGNVTYQQLDLNNRAQVKEVITSINKKYKGLHGIFHSAGMISDSFIIKKTTEEFSNVLMPKVGGTLNLDEACLAIDLDFMVLFSSSSALGSVGQADYATANAFMDTFAAYRNQLVKKGQRQGKTLAINWALWQDGGMKIEETALKMLTKTTGNVPMSTQNGMDAFYRSLASNYNQVLVSQKEFVKIEEELPQQELQQPVEKEKQNVESNTNEVIEYNTTEDINILEKTQEFLKKQFAEHFKVPPNHINPQTPLETYGIDSILSINITNQLEKTFGVLSKTLMFEYQTIEELATYFIESFNEKLRSMFAVPVNNTSKKVKESKQDTKTKPSTNISPIKMVTLKNTKKVASLMQKTQRKTSVNDELIAIVGVSGRYPESPNIETFWENLQKGKDCIIEVPKERWDWREYYTKDRTKDGYHYSKWGGFIKGHDEFDPKFFNISPKEAKILDPQERIFLQHAWMAIEDAGYTRASLQIPHERNLSGQVGVYVGVMYSEYQLFGAEISQQGKRMGFANSMADIANRVSYVLNIHGPSFTVDTMCSSSLTSIHLACQDLKLGKTDMAIAGGVNLSVHPNKYLLLSSGQYISTTGYCHSFGEGGDGYIPGEGVGAVILKRLSDAKENGDHIYGIIRGSALNHGGKANGLTVPNPQAQAAVISQVMEESNVQANHISYIEAHGTGTSLGDPIEIAALTKAFSQNNHNAATQDKKYGFCRIGSVKSNIGHCESAAGIAAVTKVLLQMKHQKIVPSLHSKTLNPNIDFDKTPFIVNQDIFDWEKPIVDGKEIPRIAGISSFGAGGANAHIIIEEYPSERTTPNEQKRVIVPISAKKPEQLQQKVLDLINFIEKEQNPINLQDMAYTLQVGREAMEERLGFIVENIDELLEKLKACLANLQEEGNNHIEGVYQGQVKRNKESILIISQDDDMKQTIDKWIVRNKIEKLLDLWVKGLDVDWQKLHVDTNPKRMSLPTYPFAKEKYWWNDAIEGGNLTLDEFIEKEAAANHIHPMLHSNTSNLGQQSYSVTFTGKEMYMKDSQIEGQKILPFVAYLEMARAAIVHALPEKQELITVTLYNIVCAAPVVIDNRKKVEIVLFADDNEHINFEIYSNSENEEMVHCQGHAYIGEQATVTRLDFTQIRAQLDENQQLSEIEIPTKTNLNGYMMHPSLMDKALEIASGLLIDLNEFYSFPSELESVQVFAPYKEKMWAWVRYTEGEQPEATHIKLDIDLCDEEGTICVQMKGINYIATHTPSLEQQESIKEETAVSSEPTEIAILTVTNDDDTSSLSQQVVIKNNIKKPTNIELLSPISSLSQRYTSFSGKVRVALSDTTTGSPISLAITSQSEFVKLYEHDKGVFVIQMNKTTLTKKYTKDLLQALNTVKKYESAKVLLLRGGETDFLHGNGKQHNEAIEAKLYNAISTFPCPVIAVMNGNASGVGYFLGIISDFMICNEQATYSFTNAQEHLFPSVTECKLFKERFGAVNAFDFIHGSTTYTGRELKDKGYSFPILSKENIEPYTQKLMAALVKKPKKSLQLLKNHLARHIQSIVNELVTHNTPSKVTSKNTTTKTKKIRITTSKNSKVQVQKDNVLVFRINPVSDDYSFIDYVSDLKTVIKQVKKTPAYKTIVIKNDKPEIFEKYNKELSIKSILEYINLILNSDIFFVSVLNANSKGMNWLLSACCDYSIYNKDAVYSTTEIMQNSDLVRVAGVIFTHKLGHTLGKEIMLSNDEYKGTELLQREKALAIVEKEQTLQTAIEIAQNWNNLPSETLITWKQYNASSIEKKLKNASKVNSKNEKFKPVLEPSTPVILKSKVISAIADPDGVLTVKMEDREAKNMFSDALTQGIVEVFDTIDKTPAYKVVVLTGFDNYFAAGGTKEDLYAIQEGKAKFTDTKFYHLAMECKIPVIAAMQGHAIGAGWSYGMFADFVLYSEESKYLSPYMNFGFTPGAGATFILPKKLGYYLSRDTLFKAQEISGSELKERGLKFPVLSRKHVVTKALEMARQIAQYPRELLITIKYQLTQHLYSEIEETYNLELAMHDETFVGQSETLSRIQNYFDKVKGEDTQNAQPLLNKETLNVQPPNEEPVNISQQEILKNITIFLAQELHMKVNEIEDDIEFIDLGLDSITGVTWVRLINEKYNLSIEATKVYSYPTLLQFSQFLKKELEQQEISTNKLDTEKPVVPPTQSTTRERVHVPEIKKTVKAPVQNNEPSETISLSAVTKNIRKFLAQELHMKENEIDDDIEFIDLGLDSITGVTWVRLINDNYNLSIEATKVYSYPTLNDFSKYVKEEVEKHGTAPIETEEIVEEEIVEETSSDGNQYNTPKITSIPAVKKLESWRKKVSSKIKLGIAEKSQLEPIAIIGMAGQYPKAKNLEEFWDNISQGKDCISKIPKTRWDLNTYYSEGEPQEGKTNCKWQGSLEEFDMFDPLFFNIAPTEAESMDPQQRLFLQSCWNTLENAGYKAKNLSGKKCGVFVGAATGDYQLLSRELQITAKGFTGSASSILAARISYFLNLQGPCLTIDTACSSSLVAIATACDSLINGDSEMALAGGVCVMSTPDLHIKSSQTGMLSKDGKCYTFDNRANGFVPGEGVGIIMLKKLSDAQKDKDNIMGVIQGWGINQDGKTNGITAPSPESQKRLMQDVYSKFKINPANIQMIEAHGTGTKLGDPIEVSALVDSFSKYTQEKGYCAIGSVKTNIGHTMAAAGIAGVLKVVLSLKNKQLPPTINFEKLNEHIQLSNTPFYVNNQLKDWNGSTPHVAAVSSFGFSGTNAHLVIAEYQGKEKAKGAVTTYPQVIIPLSARNADRLIQKANDLLQFINQKENFSLNEVAYTLQVGREEMEERLGFVVKNTEELKEKLQAYVSGNIGIDGIYTGKVNRTKEGIQFINQDNEIQTTLIDKWLDNNQIDKLLEGWVIGLSFDWNRLYGKLKPQRIELPLYPFAKERYWITAESFNTTNSKLKDYNLIHPLLHQNTSNFNQQCYTSIFSGDELFLKDHQVQLGANKLSKQKVLPGVAYLEMARAAIENALLLSSEEGVIELYNIIWIQPLVVHEIKQVTIALLVNDEMQIDFEIYSLENGEKVVYCQGQAHISEPSTQDIIDISLLKEEMQVGQLDATYTYDVLKKMGLYYGPAHQGVKTIYQGNNQVFAALMLPDVTKNIDGNNRFVLHPSIMDSAIQTLIGFTEDLEQPSNKPSIPFALDNLIILAPCQKIMYSWGRYSNDNELEGRLTKLDIDLMDEKGNICVQIRGLTFRTLQGDEKEPSKQIVKDITIDNENGQEHTTSFNAVHYETILKNILEKGVSIDTAINMED